MDNSQFTERRKHPRAQLKAEVLCYEVKEDNKRGAGILHFYSKNVSIGGIFLETRIPLEIGSVVYLKFSIPGIPTAITTRARIIGTEGKVVRINNSKSKSKNVPGMGIEFQHLGFDEQKLIDAFVKGEWEEQDDSRPDTEKP